MIWDLQDYQRAKTLNSKQARGNKMVHICPLPIDLVNRCIERWSNKGDVVFDPFGGIQTVPYCAVLKGRKGLSTELNPDYWHDGIAYLMDAEREVSTPTLFDLWAQGGLEEYKEAEAKKTKRTKKATAK